MTLRAASVLFLLLAFLSLPDSATAQSARGSAAALASPGWNKWVYNFKLTHYRSLPIFDPAEFSLLL